MPVLTDPGCQIPGMPCFYPGVSVTTEQCYAAVCGVPGLSDAQLAICAQNGIYGVKAGCLDPTCEPYRANIPQCTGGGQPTAVPPPPAPTPVPKASASELPPAPGQEPKSMMQVDTPTGPVMVPSEMVPDFDPGLTPATVHIPNIWDSLDPSKISQFEYRGPSTSFPPFFGREYRRSLAPRLPGRTGDGGAIAGEGIPWWVWVVIAGTAYALRDKR